VYLEVLEQIAEDPLQKKATQVEANSIIKTLMEAGNWFSDSILELCSEEN